MTTRPVLLVTGGLGVVGTLLRPALRQHYHLRIVGKGSPELPTDDYRAGDLLDPAFTEDAVRDVDAVLHLAANAQPRSGWQQTADNVAMTQILLKAAQRQGVPKIVLASSIHAAGLNYRDGEAPVDPAALPRPCCPYGVSKVACEALGRLHAVHTGASVLSLRLGLVGWPLTERDYNPTWLSDRDAQALVVHALLSSVRQGVYFGVSRYASAFWSLANAQSELGWLPVDDLPPHSESLPWATSSPCLLFTSHSRPA